MAVNKGIVLVGAGLLIALVLTCFLIVDNGDEVTGIIDSIIHPTESTESIGTVTVILPTGESKTMENFNPSTEGLLSIRTTKSYPDLTVTVNNEIVEMPYFQNVTPKNYAITATAFGYDNFHQSINVDAGIQINDVIVKMDRTIVENSPTNEEIGEEMIDEPVGE